MKNETKNKSLLKKFTITILLFMGIVALASASVQAFIMVDNIEKQIEREAKSISTSIQQGVKETELASLEIEHQIDLKLESYAKYIADQLYGRELSEINNNELEKYREALGISGITLFQRLENDFVGRKSTNPNEIGFEIGDFNPQASEALLKFMDGEITDELRYSVSYITENVAILYITESTSDDQKPEFFKYAYYYVLGTDYLINPYIEANEVYQFTEKVGTETWIEQVTSSNDFAKEIALLDPRVYADPSLTESVYAPLSKVVNGQFKFEDVQDTDLLISMIDHPSSANYVENYNGEKIYKSFIPIEDNKVLYVALDYEKMKAPMYKQLFILIGISILALVIVLFFTTRFFNNIYKNIQKIIGQILQMEQGDFTVQSSVKDKSELESLSNSTNKLANSLNRVLSETSDQAIQTEKHAYLLESEANNSVDKVYTMSMATTTETRERLGEMNYLLDQIEKKMLDEKIEDQETVANIKHLREVLKHSSITTTEITITLSDLLKSLHSQSESLSEISKKLLENLEQFTLDYKDDFE
ncbi:methyl-accepting chemotaxis protein [Gracilibacillus lacisalsi]|uniref:methyl-accepting chemotaxis protein n=1 Tax=Gracilibacillus lacisalsi TaxID=393087 RepID=UPI0003703028|nr:methyl-accepting chemotaxis protein [Gracilibacillus lacisalsi]